MSRTGKKSLILTSVAFWIVGLTPFFLSDVQATARKDQMSPRSRRNLLESTTQMGDESRAPSSTPGAKSKHGDINHYYDAVSSGPGKQVDQINSREQHAVEEQAADVITKSQNDRAVSDEKQRRHNEKIEKMRADRQNKTTPSHERRATNTSLKPLN